MILYFHKIHCGLIIGSRKIRLRGDNFADFHFRVHPKAHCTKKVVLFPHSRVYQSFDNILRAISVVGMGINPKWMRLLYEYLKVRCREQFFNLLGRYCKEVEIVETSILTVLAKSSNFAKKKLWDSDEGLPQMRVLSWSRICQFFPRYLVVGAFRLAPAAVVCISFNFKGLSSSSLDWAKSSRGEHEVFSSSVQGELIELYVGLRFSTDSNGAKKTKIVCGVM